MSHRWKQALHSVQDLAVRIGNQMHRFLVDWGWVAERKWRRLPPEKYGSYLEDHHPDRDWFVEWVASQAPCSVLEIGAGSLHEVRMLRDRGDLGQVRYTVVDVAEHFLEQGRREFPQVTFVKGTIQRLRFPDDQFDVVYCRAVLEHQPYYTRPLDEMFRVSRKYVVVNLFRWSLHRDIIRHVKYYSNSYQIDRLLEFVRSRSRTMTHFLVLKGQEPGPNRYEDPNIRRTGDHLVIIAAKQDVTLGSPLEILRRKSIHFLPERYSPLVKT